MDCGNDLERAVLCGKIAFKTVRMRLNTIDEELFFVNRYSVLDCLNLGCNGLDQVADGFVDSVRHCVNFTLLCDVERVVNRIDCRLDRIVAFFRVLCSIELVECCDSRIYFIVITGEIFERVRCILQSCDCICYILTLCGGVVINAFCLGDCCSEGVCRCLCANAEVNCLCRIDCAEELILCHRYRYGTLCAVSAVLGVSGDYRCAAVNKCYRSVLYRCNGRITCCPDNVRNVCSADSELCFRLDRCGETCRLAGLAAE